MTAIGDDAQDQPEPNASDGDYSYDLVHDEVPTARRSERAPGRSHPGPGAEPEGDESGDYSYDLAHEVPPSRPR